MLNRIKQRLNSKSNKNILTLFSGNVLAQVIPFLFAPWIARIYTPAELGVFALIFSAVSVLSTIANARYEMAIVVPKDDGKAFNLLGLSIVIAVVLCCILLPFSFFLRGDIAMLLKNDSIEDYLYFVPIIALLIGIYNPLKYYFTREAKFKILSISQIAKSMSQAFFQVGLGLLKFKEAGLIIGYLISQFFGNGAMIKSFVKTFKQHPARVDVSLSSIKEVALEYKDFPKYSVWGIFINNLAQNITIFYIATLYGNENLGYYSFMQRYINAPLFLISTTIGQVYIQEFSKRIRDGKFGLNVFYSYIKKLSLLSVVLVILIYIFVGKGIEVIFGANWLRSGEIVIIMLPLFFIKFIATPLTTTVVVLEQQKKALFLQAGIFLFTVLPIVYAHYFDTNLFSFLGIQTLILFVYYTFLLLFIRRMIINSKPEKIEI